MSARSGSDRFVPMGIEDDVLYQVSTHLIFDSLVRNVVRDHYGLRPVHVTLQIEHDEVMLFVKERDRTLFFEDPELYDWALGFIAGDVFSIEPDSITIIYLDGAVDMAAEAYLYISGDGVLISSGTPRKKGWML